MMTASWFGFAVFIAVVIWFSLKVGREVEPADEKMPHPE